MRGELDQAEALLRQGSDKGHTDSQIKLALLLEEDRHDSRAAETVLRAAAAAGELHAHDNWDPAARPGRVARSTAALRLRRLPR